MNIDLVIATYNRADQLAETLTNVKQWANGLNKIYVVNNNSQDNTAEVLRHFEDDQTVVIHNSSNLGAAGGKNVGLRRSTADVIIVIDDDALFCSSDPVAHVRDRFEANPRLGIIQFKIINYQTKRVLKYEFPADDPDRRADDAFDIGYFIGAGHAIRKSMLEEVGYYPDDFGIYAHEEIDLSYRAVNAGYMMRYTPEIAVYHKKAPGGRLTQREVAYHLLYNRLIMTHKYLPFPYSAINTLLWLVKTTFDVGSPSVAIAAYWTFLRRKRHVAPTLLSRDALRYMHRNGGRLFR